MSRPPEDQPFDRRFDQPYDQPHDRVDDQVPGYGTPPPDAPPVGYGPTPDGSTPGGPTPYDAPVPGAAPGYGTPPPDHRPYAAGAPAGRRRPGGNVRLITSLLPLVAIVLFFVLRGNGVGAFWLPLVLVLGVGVVTQILRRGSFRD